MVFKMQFLNLVSDQIYHVYFTTLGNESSPLARGFTDTDFLQIQSQLMKLYDLTYDSLHVVIADSSRIKMGARNICYLY